MSKKSTLPVTVTIQQAAEVLQVHDRTIRRWIADGTLDAKRVGPRLLRVKRESIDNLIGAGAHR
ncbi:helix-turn-helix domain-containing protein [Mycolicibacterium sp.]|uniref:helix-turn-helix domain-containing protein n=1 Tax=Mycolicibacterium sp. TaxID=2320850 RepID=UPI00356098C1